MIYKNSDISRAIDEYVHVAWQREVCRLRFCEGMTYEEIAETTGYSTVYIKKIVKKHRETLFAHL